MKHLANWIGGILAAAVALPTISARADQDLAAGFQNPPDSAKAHTWWHWMNGNITREGITADLEAMKHAGVGGAQILNVLCWIPHGPVQVLGPEWRKMMRHAFAEGDRLGLEICVHNCPGYTSSGGPWVKPEQAMQIVTASHLVLQGPTNFSATLPEPDKRKSFYRDIAVLAFPSMPGEEVSMRDFKPKISASEPAGDLSQALDGSPETMAQLPMPEPDKPSFLQLEFAEPFEAHTLTVWLPTGLHTHTAELQVSEDGQSFRKVRELTLVNRGWLPSWQTDSFPAAKGHFFRLVLLKSRTKAKTIGIAEISLGAQLQLDQINMKAGFDRANNLGSGLTFEVPAGMKIERSKILDLTSKLDASGKLTWQAPAGRWTILRLGHTCTGKVNHPAPPEAVGLEVDKCSREAVDAFWAGGMEPLIREAGPLAGRSFNSVLMDSYEVGSQNWTPRMREEFRKRRGYDLLPFLPALTGRVVDNPETSERFLWDFRRTIADLYAENYFGRLRELCHKSGLKLSAEPYGNGIFDELRGSGQADIPMGEFWSRSGEFETLKLAASAAHTRGRQVVGAEAFTSGEKDDAWRLDPWAMKAVGDKAWCEGVNRYVFHRYALQPWLDQFPGMTMGPYGLHFERTQTWWEPGAAWLRYIARCQFLLQSGRFVADLCYFIGESQPATLPTRAFLKPAAPAGYDYDGCDSEMLGRFKVISHQLVLPSGMSYRTLVLPDTSFMTPPTIAKVRELVRDGATVVGPRPVKSPSLVGFPGCDAEVARIAQEVWGDCDGKAVRVHAFGGGKVVDGMPLAQVLAAAEATPDFQNIPEVRYIHRRAKEADIYFVASQGRAPRQIECSFRIAGKQPELWHPDTGIIEPTGLWTERNGRTIIPLRLDAAGSVFVLFRKPAGTRDHAVALARIAGPAGGAFSPRITIREAVYEGVGGGGKADVTLKVAELVRNGQTSISVDNEHFGDPAYLQPKRLRVDYLLDGKKVQKMTDEKQVLELSKTSDLPDAVLGVSADGMPVLKAFAAGTYEVKTAQGKSFTVEVQATPAPLDVVGPWTLRFPRNQGAPELAQLERLTSWTEHSEAGIRHFSGTAAYETKFEAPASLHGGSRRLWLDLGAVKNLATVTLNGKDFEPLWKPPFRLDVTGALKPGRNTLVVKVTNLWPNRLIGDEQFPDDLEWDGNSLKAWPQWLLKGEPRPTTERVTFTTWRHYQKDSPLLESGLLGPVTIQAAAIQPVPGL